jgi:hypothetical protein
MMTIRPGTNLTKTASHRKAQVSATTTTHAILYWPDADTQTKVRHERFNRRAEWTISPNDLEWNQPGVGEGQPA